MVPAMRFAHVGRQRVPLQTSFALTAGSPVPTPVSPVIPVPTPASPATPLVPSVGKPFKFVLASSKTIAGWFGVTCEDCPGDSIWGCYVTKTCWRVVIVALGAIFTFIALLMAIFFLGQIDDLLKYQRQLTEYEKEYPTLARIMIGPLKLFHKAFTKSYDKTMKSLTRKFGKKPWFKFLVVFPCKCLKGTWTIFQKVLQPVCLFSCTTFSKIKKCIANTGFFQWAIDKTLKKVSIRPDPKGDKKREKKLKKEAKEATKQAKIDAKQAKIEEKKAKKQAKKDEKAAAKQAKLEEKAARKQAKLDAKKAKKEAQREAREARNDVKLDALEDAKEAKRDVEEAAEEAREEAKEAEEEARKEAEEKVSKAPPTSPAPPSPPPPGPPPSPAPLGVSLVMPMTPLALAMSNQQAMYGAPAQQYVDPYATQQYVDLYTIQQYVAEPYGGYGAPMRQEAQGQGYRTYGQEQYGMYGNYSKQGPYTPQQEAYGQDQYGILVSEQQASDYGYDPNGAITQQYPQQQFGEQQYYYGQ